MNASHNGAYRKSHIPTSDMKLNCLLTLFFVFLRSCAVGSVEPSIAEGAGYGEEAGEGGGVGYGGEVLGVERGAGEAVFVGERL